MIQVEIINNKEILNKLFKIIDDLGFICGGFARVCVEVDNKIPCNDIDIYCKSEESFNILKNRLLENGYVIKRESGAALSYSYVFEGDYPIQLIKPISEGHTHITDEDIANILNNFDFTICRVGIYKKGNDLKAMCDDDFMRDSDAKELHIKDIHCPVAEIYRILKYLRKGFSIRTFEIIKVLTDWEQRPDEYKNNLINKLQKENPSQEEIDELESLLHID